MKKRFQSALAASAAGARKKIPERFPIFPLSWDFCAAECRQIFRRDGKGLMTISHKSPASSISFGHEHEGEPIGTPAPLKLGIHHPGLMDAGVIFLGGGIFGAGSHGASSMGFSNLPVCHCMAVAVVSGPPF
jgi:hypothetical protein